MIGLALALLLTPPAAPAEQAAFFESKIRPALIDHCQKCHGPSAAKGGLRLDGRAALLVGGDGGPAVVPGDPSKGTLLDAIRYGNADLQMPPKGKLPDAVARDFEAWVVAGAPWPESGAEPAPAAVGKPAFDLAARKASHWAWQPPRRAAPPAVADSGWPRDPVDRFALAKLEAAGLAPSPDAPKLVWLRRATFAVTGLPPTPAEQTAFEADDTPEAAAARVVDRLLASPHYGERWGRHWLDLVRYAESRGHEFDHTIPNAYQYRDYVVRALNGDVPYDQFVREHLAGDVLPAPRLDPATGGDESVLATGFWHLGEEVHSPVDLRQDQCDRLDNRIDVFGKAFLGLTVACARCHDHKFDAISAQDYAALFGLLQGGGYRQVRFDGRAESRKLAGELAEFYRRTGADARFVPRSEPGLEAWRPTAATLLDAARLAPGEWLPDDVAYGAGPRAAGSLARTADGTWFVEPRATVAYDPFWAGRAEASGAEAEPHALKRRPPPGGAFRTRTLPLRSRYVHALVRGQGTAYAAVCGHTILDGPLHGRLLQDFDAPGRQYRWLTFDLAEYKGWPLHLEFSAAPGGDFAVALVAMADSAPPELAPAPEVAADLPDGLRERLDAELAALRERVPRQSRLAPALWDGPSVDEAVFVRGNPRAPGPVVPRRNLAALGGKPLNPERGGGRRELALELTDPQRNPLLARVAVNRAWHHLFGRGLVATVDNFGALGEAPTHPELLDALALDFTADGFSTKRLLRRLLLSRAFAMSSDAAPLATERDPGNVLLSHFRVQRLEGEAIRDAILSASGRLDSRLGGPGVPVELTAFQDGRGRPESGPRDGAGRRSLYLGVRRNFLSPFLLAFDTPIPATAVGRRQVSNVPAQALILMNDPFVRAEADRLARRVQSESEGAPARVELLYRLTVGRPATAAESAACAEYLGGAGAEGWADLAHGLMQAKEFSYVR